MKKLTVQLIDIALILLMNIFFLHLSVPIAIISSLIIYLGIYSFRVYDTQTMKSYTESLIKTTVGTLISFILILILYFFLSKYFNRYFFLYNLLFTIIILPILHKIEYKIYEKTMPVKNYLVIEKKEEIGHIMQEISEKTLNKIRFTQYINPNPITLDEIIKQNDQQTSSQIIHGIVITDPELEKHVKPQIQHYKEEGMDIEYLPNMAEKYLNRIPIEVAQKFKEYYEVIFNNVQTSPAQQIIDKFFGSLLLIIFSPIMLIISIATLIEDGRPVIYKQKRMGKNEKIFTINKFRSLKEAQINEYNPNEDIEKRVLKTGKVIRKLRLDELPQFWNIIKGDMSIVGPRPEMIEFHNLMSSQIPFYNYRLKLNPGITGWAQIHYKHTSTLEDYIKKTEYDLYYIKNRNIFLDLQIMLKTLETMLGMRGAR
ncbi:exopolysaccharide biosynthesis polyprenyl glycosylphosphotransferase [Defluviitoga tunisiensis]|uniref:Exopolysaccharide biosynthesis polyprenyl glycosylphosphotransferase n=1 Tax=Defluviitoga tunisiensis TaxID=1006576 RepID=A0A0C7NYH6_DEFTU|nr:exopolysaccharide biosynthesis polyprenyl glycosylphosphotransferase [Defluviitoga tunisiensis]CEP78278.1 exopolysaccharide biosynthesis polyprenyl glycosylphosphotransferase [Defluviitoga tunisiensis]